MAISKAKILLVEDDENLGFILSDFLELSGYEVDLQKNGRDGYISFVNKPFDLCILDVMLPIKDGFTLAEDIRKKNQEIPIIFLTAKSLEVDRIRGFKLGADDYITKPFSKDELALRIEVIFKRLKLNQKQESDIQIFNIGKYTFDYVNQVLILDKSEKHLTKREADMLRLLCLHENQLLKREVALKSIWGSDDYFMGRSMDVYIAKLRKYLKDDSSITINNIHGAGFKLEVEAKS